MYLLHTKLRLQSYRLHMNIKSKVSNHAGKITNKPNMKITIMSVLMTNI